MPLTDNNARNIFGDADKGISNMEGTLTKINKYGFHNQRTSFTVKTIVKIGTVVSSNNKKTDMNQNGVEIPISTENSM